MTEIYLLSRVVHVVFGAFWMGVVVFAAFYLMPSVAEAGPDGAKVMGGLVRRKYLAVVPIVAVTNLVSGFWLYYRFTAGFDPGLSGTRGAMAFGTGGILAVLAFGIGMHGMRRNLMKAMALGAQAAGMAEGPDRAALLNTAAGLRKRAMFWAPIVAVMLILTASLMAIGHYI
jgi:hypothetical protein